MSNQKVKSTAVGVATLRAIASFERDAAVRNPDYLAVYLLPLKFRLIAKIHILRWFVRTFSNRMAPGSYYFHTARAKCIDAMLEQSINEGLEQLVILGAGLDTRAYRFHDMLRHVKVFEVDHPNTQAMKKARITRLPLSHPVNVSYVSLDFNDQNLDELIKNGYSSTLRTLFIWEGVCMYLTAEAVDKVLVFTSEHSGPGSSIIFDYIFQSMVEGKCDYYGARESAKYVEKKGEPYLFGIEEGTINEFLENRGLKLISEYTPTMLEKAFMTRSDGTVHGKVYAYTNIVHALL